MGFTPVAVETTRLNPDGSAPAGTITFTLVAEMLNGTTLVQPSPIVGVFNPAGQLVQQDQQSAIILLANDDVGTTPADPTSAYRVVEQLAGTELVSYIVYVLHAATITETDGAAVLDSNVVQLNDVIASSAMVGHTFSGPGFADGTTVLSASQSANTVTVSNASTETVTGATYVIGGGVDLSTLAQYAEPPELVAYIPWVPGDEVGDFLRWNGTAWVSSSVAPGGVDSVTAADSSVTVDNDDPANPTISAAVQLVAAVASAVGTANGYTDEQISELSASITAAFLQLTGGTLTGDLDVQADVTIDSGGQLVANDGSTAKMRMGQKSNSEIVWSYNVDQNNSDAIDDPTASAFKFSMQGTEGGGYDGLHLQYAPPDAPGGWGDSSTVFTLDGSGDVWIAGTFDTDGGLAADLDMNGQRLQNLSQAGEDGQAVEYAQWQAALVDCIQSLTSEDGSVSLTPDGTNVDLSVADTVATALASAESFATTAANGAQAAAEAASDPAGSAATAQSNAESFTTAAVLVETDRAEAAEALALLKANNLLDIESATAALANLGVPDLYAGNYGVVANSFAAAASNSAILDSLMRYAESLGGAHIVLPNGSLAASGGIANGGAVYITKPLVHRAYVTFDGGAGTQTVGTSLFLVPGANCNVRQMQRFISTSVAAFAASTVYTVNVSAISGFVTYNGYYYQCILGYTSTSETPDMDPAHWRVLSPVNQTTFNNASVTLNQTPQSVTVTDGTQFGQFGGVMHFQVNNTGTTYIMLYTGVAGNVVNGVTIQSGSATILGTETIFPTDATGTVLRNITLNAIGPYIMSPGTFCAVDNYSSTLGQEICDNVTVVGGTGDGWGNGGDPAAGFCYNGQRVFFGCTSTHNAGTGRIGNTDSQYVGDVCGANGLGGYAHNVGPMNLSAKSWNNGLVPLWKAQRTTSGDVHTTAGSTTITSSSAAFVADDIGQCIYDAVDAETAGTVFGIRTVIIAVASATSATISQGALASATTTVANIAGSYVWPVRAGANNNTTGVVSPVDGYFYLLKNASVTSNTDPSSDSTNWRKMRLANEWGWGIAIKTSEAGVDVDCQFNRFGALNALNSSGYTARIRANGWTTNPYTEAAVPGAYTVPAALAAAGAINLGSSTAFDVAAAVQSTFSTSLGTVLIPGTATDGSVRIGSDPNYAALISGTISGTLSVTINGVSYTPSLGQLLSYLAYNPANQQTWSGISQNFPYPLDPVNITLAAQLPRNNVSGIMLVRVKGLAKPGTSGAASIGLIGHNCPTLSTATGTSAGTVALAINALIDPIPNGTQITLVTGTTRQIFTTTAAADVGATTLAVASITPTTSFPADGTNSGTNTISLGTIGASDGSFTLTLNTSTAAWPSAGTFRVTVAGVTYLCSYTGVSGDTLTGCTTLSYLQNAVVIPANTIAYETTAMFVNYGIPALAVEVALAGDITPFDVMIPVAGLTTASSPGHIFQFDVCAPYSTAPLTLYAGGTSLSGGATQAPFVIQAVLG